MAPELIIGAHINKHNTYLDTIKLGKSIKANTIQIFIGSPKDFKIITIDKKEAQAIADYVLDNNIFLISHAKYILNLASPKPFVHHVYAQELNNIYRLGGYTSVIHLGKQTKMTFDEAYNNMITNIKKTIAKVYNPKEANYKDKVKYLRIGIETSSGQGSEMLTTLPELGQFFNEFTKQEKKLISFIVDTCHIFAAGHDIRSKENATAFLKEWDKHIGLKNIITIHLNDSHGQLGSKVDRHAQLGAGYICNSELGGSFDGIKVILKEAKKRSIPLILERGSKDIDLIEKEIELIKKLK